MAEYLVTDTDMISLADTIRAKGGTSSPLTFPNGMKTAVNAIPSGGGGITTTIPIANFLRVYYDITDNYYYEGVDISVYRGASAFAKTTLLHTENNCDGVNSFDVNVAAASGQWITITYTQYKNYGGYTPKIVLKHSGYQETQETYSTWADINANFKVSRTQYNLSTNLNEITFQAETGNYGYAIYLAAVYED